MIFSVMETKKREDKWRSEKNVRMPELCNWKSKKTNSVTAEYAC